MDFFSFVGNTVFSRTVMTILDILVVAFLIYKIISLFMDTQAMSLIKGLAVLFGINIIANYMRLDALNWILQQATTVALVAIPVVFQPELRKALERIGRGKFLPESFDESQAEETERSVDEIVKAASFMSKERIGALMVIERETGVKDLAQVGIEIGAHISSELIINIFIPNTPLHDGAVIIKDNKIVSAACVLPLSNRKSVGRKIGTRHRAALGITEQTDAIAVVVSEETGMISIAMNGDFLTVHDESGVLRALKDELVPKAKSYKFFRRGEQK